MFRWLQNRMAHASRQDLRPQPRILTPEPPRPIAVDETDRRLQAMIAAKDLRSWPELIEWLEHRADTLRNEKAKLQHQLAAAQSFVRFKR